jgi:hypothetical protein
MRVLVPYAITDARLSSSSVPESDYPAWSAATAYAAGQRVIRTQTHRIYERQTAGTSAAAPEADEVRWLDVGPTNRWAMLDESVGSSTTATGSLSVTLAMPGPVGDVVLLDVIGSSVAIAANGSTVRTVAVPAPAATGLGSTVVVSGLAIGGAPSIGVTVTGSGTVSVGTLSVGTFTSLGQPERGQKLGIVDYSTKAFDAYGSASVVRRNSARRVEAAFTTAPTSFDQLARVLAAVRSRPVIWQGLTWVDATCVYGICADWSLSLQLGIVRGAVSVRGLGA